MPVQPVLGERDHRIRAGGRGWPTRSPREAPAHPPTADRRRDDRGSPPRRRPARARPGAARRRGRFRDRRPATSAGSLDISLSSARGAQQHHAGAGVGKARQRPAARERFVVGMREHGENRPARQLTVGHDGLRGSASGPGPRSWGPALAGPDTSWRYTASYSVTIRSTPKRATARSRTRRRSSANTAGRPAASLPRSRRCIPVTPSSTTSRTAPRSRAATGVPQAIASASTSPNGSELWTG